jgi:hypothetical protein
MYRRQGVDCPRFWRGLSKWPARHSHSSVATRAPAIDVMRRPRARRRHADERHPTGFDIAAPRQGTASLWRGPVRRSLLASAGARTGAPIRSAEAAIRAGQGGRYSEEHRQVVSSPMRSAVGFSIRRQRQLAPQAAMRCHRYHPSQRRPNLEPCSVSSGRCAVTLQMHFA